MYKCRDCGAVFDEYRTQQEWDEFGHVYYYHQCPACWSDDIDDTERCLVCDEWMLASEMSHDFPCCKNCMREILDVVDRAAIKELDDAQFEIWVQMRRLIEDE